MHPLDTVGCNYLSLSYVDTCFCHKGPHICFVCLRVVDSTAQHFSMKICIANRYFCCYQYMMRSSVILPCGSVFAVLGRRWKSRHFRGIHYFVFSSLAFFIRGMKWTSFIFSAVTRLAGFEKHRRFPDGKQCQLGGIRHRCRGWYRTRYRCYAPLYEICTRFCHSVAIVLHLKKQFVNNWHSPCCQCMYRYDFMPLSLYYKTHLSRP